MRTAVIMAGGKGERFWPRSRKQLPKQFLSLVGEQSMLQATVGRLAGLLDLSQIFVVTNERYASIVASQLPALPERQIIVEPAPRNTAPCIALAAQYVASLGVTGEIAFLPSDHYFGSAEELSRALDTAYRLAAGHAAWVTLGICPDSPETRYGYMQRGKRVPMPEADGLPAQNGVYEVDCFLEKPSSATAERCLASGDFYWNSGIYSVSLEYLAISFQMLAPDIWRAVQATVHDQADPWETYGTIRDISIDYAIAEREKRMLVVETKLVWNDLGSWRSVADMQAADQNGHVVRGVDYVSLDSSGCVVDSAEPGLVALLGVRDLLVVRDGDVLLVCAKERADDVKAILEELRTRSREEYL